MGLKRDGIRKVKDNTVNKYIPKKVEELGLSSINIEQDNKYKIKEVEEITETSSRPIEELKDDTKEVIEEVIEKPIETPPSPNDEVVEVSDEEVEVEPVKVRDVKTEEYLKLLEEEKDKKDEDKKVICLDTLDVYINAKDAESKTPAKAGAITRNCNGNSKRAGGLCWMYYLDYLKEN